MKVIKIRTVEEAQRLALPPIPDSYLEAAEQFRRRVASSNMSRHSVLRGVYEQLDRVVELVDPFTVCSPGCSACCHIAVGITEVEASYIERNTGRPMRRGVVSSSVPPSLGPCPLLDADGRCSVYSARPFMCRVFAAFDDPALCAQLDAKHMVYQPDANAIFEDGAQWVRELNRGGAVADIRAFFGA